MKTKLITAILTLLLITGCAYKPGIGSYSDAATTAAIITSDSFTEANPIINTGDPFTAAIVSIGLKQGLKYIVSPEYSDHVDTTIESVGVFGAGWNASLLLGGSYAVAGPVGVLSGIIYYRYRVNKREAQ